MMVKGRKEEADDDNLVLTLCAEGPACRQPLTDLHISNANVLHNH